MTEDEAQSLLTTAGRDLLAEADRLRAARVETLTALMHLRKAAAPAHAAAAWEMSDLRQRGTTKFGPDAAQMLFTRESLEQASGRRAAAYHAARFTHAGMTHVLDLCGGIGGDALAFAHQGLSVTLYERDPVRALFAAENARVCGVTDKIDVRPEDVTCAVLPHGAVWFDPARRTDSRRVTQPEDYLPPLSFVRDLVGQGLIDFGIKLAPALDHSVAADYSAGLEFLSEGGECKEALLWGGALRAALAGDVCATRLTDGEPQSLAARVPAVIPEQDTGGGAFLYEPDPAVIRAHLVGELAGRLHARLVDPQIAYLIGDAYVATPFAAAYVVRERFVYSRRRLQEALNRLDVGQVVIKKRGFPLEPDAVRKQLKLAGTQTMTVILTRQGETHHAFLCRPV